MSTATLGLLLEVVSVLVAGLIGYFSAYNALNARVSVLEAQWVTLNRDLGEIKGDVKTLLERGR